MLRGDAIACADKLCGSAEVDDIQFETGMGPVTGGCDLIP
jgi:hypothetical protein